MPALTLDFAVKTQTEAMLLEEGAKDEKWPVVCDGRIKPSDGSSIGPVVYKGTPDVKDGPVTKALFIFQDQSDSVVALLENADENDLNLTVASYLDLYGASVSAMRAKRPSVEGEQSEA
jgi:hypothetical protein